jgi:mono/diheme cytochrome c family protein
MVESTSEPTAEGSSTVNPNRAPEADPPQPDLDATCLECSLETLYSQGNLGRGRDQGQMLFDFTCKRLVAIGAAGLACLVVAACGVTQLGATDANLAQARDRAAQGASLFAGECARCHGERGEGQARVPAIIGAGALPVYPGDQARSADTSFSDPQTLQEEARFRPAGAPSRDPFRTAQDVHGFVSTRMPLPNQRAGSLQPEAYWALVSFILIAHGSQVPEGGVNAANASSISVQP